jgi:thiol-disulfide isomerase/thioredoxin
MMLLLFFIQIFLFATISSSESLLDAGKKGAETEQNGKGATKSSPFIDLLGDTLYKWKINADDTMEVEELSTAELLKGKTAVAIYFSASWCGPCKQFTPFLAQLYKNLQKKGKKFEVVWLSRDRSSEEFLGYYQKMPWLAVTLQNLQPVLEKIAPMFQLKVGRLLYELSKRSRLKFILSRLSHITGDSSSRHTRW